jgi:hypothetical protein
LRFGFVKKSHIKSDQGQLQVHSLILKVEHHWWDASIRRNENFHNSYGLEETKDKKERRSRKKGDLYMCTDNHMNDMQMEEKYRKEKKKKIQIYGLIATLLYRFEKKIDEKNFSILNAMNSAFYSIIWQENRVKVSRLPLLDWRRYEILLKNTEVVKYKFLSYILKIRVFLEVMQVLTIVVKIVQSILNYIRFLCRYILKIDNKRAINEYT